MSKKEIFTKNAPSPVGTYSQAVVAEGRAIFLAGQIGLEPQSGILVDGFEKQTRQIFANIGAVAKACGGSLDNVVKITVFLLDMGNFSLVNELMGELFTKPYPARSTIQVAALPKGALVEIEAIIVV